MSGSSSIPRSSRRRCPLLSLPRPAFLCPTARRGAPCAPGLAGWARRFPCPVAAPYPCPGGQSPAGWPPEAGARLEQPSPSASVPPKTGLRAVRSRWQGGARRVRLPSLLLFTAPPPPPRAASWPWFRPRWLEDVGFPPRPTPHPVLSVPSLYRGTSGLDLEVQALPFPMGPERAQVPLRLQ